jgi:hypothetical protein
VNTVPKGEVDSRLPYLVFAPAYLIGHGANALNRSGTLDLPGWLPLTLFGAGLVPALALALRAGMRSQQGAGESRKKAEMLLGTAWFTGFLALILAVTGLTSVAGREDLQDVLWPAGSVLVVGMITIAEGAARHNTLHYTLGSWLAVVGAASLFFDTPGVYGTLAVAAGGGYLVATVLERRRLASAQYAGRTMPVS